MIKICSIKQEFYDLFDDSIELERNNKRPCLLIMKLKFRNKKYNFAIPFRSNINKGATRKEYFPLPTRSTTKKYKKHGLHYIKMFPITKNYISQFYIDKNDKENINDYEKIKKNYKEIIKESQEYLKNYENGIRYNFCTDIDIICSVLENELMFKGIEKEIAVDYRSTRT